MNYCASLLDNLFLEIFANSQYIMVACFRQPSKIGVPSAIQRRQRTMVAWISPIDLSIFELSMRGIKAASAFLIKCFYIVRILWTFFMYLLNLGSIVMCFVLTANRSLCLSSFVIQIIKGMHEGYFFIIFSINRTVK